MISTNFSIWSLLIFQTNETTLILIIVTFTFLEGDVPRGTLYGIYIFQLLRFVRASSQVCDINNRNNNNNNNINKTA